MIFIKSFQSFFGAASVAASSFIVSYLLLKFGDTKSFGIFSTFVLLQGMFFGVLNSVICTPLSKYTHGNGEQFELIENEFIRKGIIIGVLCSIITFAAIFNLSQNLHSSIFFSLSMLVGCYRWVLRAKYNNRGANSNVFWSDVAFFLVSVFFVCIVFFDSSLFDLFFVSLLTFTSMLVGLIAFPIFRDNVFLKPKADKSVFKEAYQKQGKHALVGVIFTELSLSFHAYAITLIFGPAQFAPFAAAYMYFRPLTLFFSNFVMMQRGYLVKLYISGENGILKTRLKQFLFILFSCYVFNALIIILSYYKFPDLIWMDKASFDDFSFILFTVIALFAVRVLKFYYSFSMQVYDSFYLLSRISFFNFGIVATSVIFALVFFKPSYTVYALLISEILTVIAYYFYAKRARMTR